MRSFETGGPRPLGPLEVVSAEVPGAPYEAVSHPKHYGGADDPYECVKVAEAWGFDRDAYKFDALKYLRRAGTKPGADEVQDLKKAVWYIQRRIARLEQERQKEAGK